MSGIIIGTKISQSQFFTQSGKLVPVTKIATDPCYLVGIFTKEKNGYSALMLGYGTRKTVSKPVAGLLKKAGITDAVKHIKEIRTDDFKDILVIEEDGKSGVKIGEKNIFIGDKLDINDLFNIGEKVSVSGITQGKGFAGVVRRYNFRGGPKTHGQSDRHRARGSLGSGTTPGRVFKGLRMAGRMGQDRVTIKNLEVVSMEPNVFILKGVVPGKKGGIVEVVTAK
jgi:large subunit ribosomal protein L3